MKGHNDNLIIYTQEALKRDQILPRKVKALQCRKKLDAHIVQPMHNIEKSTLIILSKTGHVLSCLNIGGSPSKPKYNLITDSAQVP